MLYGPKADGTWPIPGTSLAGPPGSPGKGASVASLAAGDAHCANGGASVTDGSGNTAYACTGGTGPPGPAGSADLHSFQVTGSAGTVTIRPSVGFSSVGLVEQVTTAAAGVYLMNATVFLEQSVPGTSEVECTLYVDASQAGPGFSFGSVDTSSPYATIPVLGEVAVTADTHTFEVLCANLSAVPVQVVSQASAMTGFRSS